MASMRSQKESQEYLLNRQLRNIYLDYFEKVLVIRKMPKPMIGVTDRMQGV